MNIPDAIFTRDEVLAFIAADRASASRATPEGWVCVPREPTNDMLLALCEVKNRAISGTRWVARDSDLAAMWGAAIAAAPPVAVEATKAVALTDSQRIDGLQKLVSESLSVKIYGSHRKASFAIERWGDEESPETQADLRAAIDVALAAMDNKEPK